MYIYKFVYVYIYMCVCTHLTDHQDRPVFGWLFQDEPVALKLPTGQPMLANRPVVDLITWLQTIQE